MDETKASNGRAVTAGGRHGSLQVSFKGRPSSRPDAGRKGDDTRGHSHSHRQESTRLGSALSAQDYQGKENLIASIVTIVSNDPSKSMFHYGVAEAFAKQFNAPVPVNWLDVIKDCDGRLEVEEKTFYKGTVKITISIPVPTSRKRSGAGLPTKPETVAKTCNNLVDVSSSATPDTNQAMGSASGDDTDIRWPRRPPSLGQKAQKVPNSVVLPGTETWNVIVTKVVNTNEILLRLVDTVEKYADLLEEMGSFYLANERPVKQVVAKRFYAAKFEETTLRVQADFEDADKVYCMYVDEGGFEALDRKRLHELDPQFLELPFQAFSVQLQGLSDYKNSEVATKYLQLLVKSVPNSVFVAVPCTRKDSLEVVLYDVSRDTEDRDINEEVLSHVKAHAYDLIMSKTGVSTNVCLTFCDSEGNIYLQLEDEFYAKFIGKVATVSQVCRHEAADTPKYAQLKGSVGKKDVYYALFDDSWCRCFITKVLDPGHVQVFYVDYGNDAIISVNDVRVVDKIVDPLHSLPFLAVKCRLENVPNNHSLEWCSKTSDELLKLFEPDEILVMNVIQGLTPQTPVSVQLFRVVNGERVLLNVKLAANEKCFAQRRAASGPKSIPGPLVIQKPKVEPVSKAFDSFSRSSSTSGPSSHSRSSTPSRDMGSPLTIFTNGSTATAAAAAAAASGETLGLNGSNGASSSGDDVLSNGQPIPEALLPKVNPNPVQSGDYFDVVVTLAATPNNFYVQSYNSIQLGTKFTELRQEMQEFYENEENWIDLHPDLIREGIYAAAKFTDKSWYRVRVMTVISKEPMELMCHFVDFGDLHSIDLKNLQPLFTQFRNLAKQAIRASLHTVEPIGGDWDVMACYDFTKMVEGKALVSTVYSLEGSPSEPLLLLSLCDTTGSSDVVIDQVLVNKKYAKSK